MHDSRFLPGPAGRLDSRWQGPPGGAPVLLLHPHPAHGGSMGSRLVFDLAEGLAGAGYRAVRFDTRGVGRSDGDVSDGGGETQDALAVFDAVAEEAGRAPAVVGHSFGGGVAVRLATLRDGAVTVLVAVPPRIGDSALAPIDDAPRARGPVHLVVGTDDPFLTREGVGSLRAAFPAPGASLHALQGADHFLDATHTKRALQAVLSVLGREGFTP